MTGTFVTKLAVLAVLALVALIAVQGTTAKTLPITEVAAPASLARIQHPGGTSDLARFANFRGGPTGVYTMDRFTATMAALSNIRHPGFVGTVSR